MTLLGSSNRSRTFRHTASSSGAAGRAFVFVLSRGPES
jgi:hypothetical protein